LRRLFTERYVLAGRAKHHRDPAHAWLRDPVAAAVAS